MENINVSKDEGSPYKDQDNYDFVKPKNRSSNDLFKQSPKMQKGKISKDNLTVSRKHDSSSKSKNKKLNELVEMLEDSLVIRVITSVKLRMVSSNNFYDVHGLICKGITFSSGFFLDLGNHGRSVAFLRHVLLFYFPLVFHFGECVLGDA